MIVADEQKLNDGSGHTPIHSTYQELLLVEESVAMVEQVGFCWELPLVEASVAMAEQESFSLHRL